MNEPRHLEKHTVLDLSRALRGELAVIASEPTDSDLMNAARRAQSLIDELEHQITALHTAATTDPLTGAPNRSAFLHALDHALLSSTTTSVVLLDLDNFKHVNDTLGHLAGDELLHAVVQRLMGSLRGNDTFGRLGGDEFGVVLAGADLTQAQRVVERLCDSLASAPFYAADQELTISMSVGIADQSAGASAMEMLAEADRSLYRAKQRSIAASA